MFNAWIKFVHKINITKNAFYNLRISHFNIFPIINVQ